MSKSAAGFLLAVLFLSAWNASARPGLQESVGLPSFGAFPIGEKILGYDAAPGTGQDAIKRPLEPDVRQTNSAGTGLGIYRGVVFGGFLPVRQQIVCDFGAQGIWLYDGGWRQLSGADPDWIISYGQWLAADFGDLGIWVWEYKNVYNGIWTQLSGANAVWGFAGGSYQTRLFVNFGSQGVWHYRLNWGQGSVLEPVHGLNWKTKSGEAVFCFPGQGVWSFINDGAQLRQLTGTETLEDDHVSGRFMNSETSDNLIMDFGGLGLWMISTGLFPVWIQISADDVNRLVAANLGAPHPGAVILDNFKPGLYYWHYTESLPGIEVRLSAATPDPFGFCEPFDFNQDYPMNDDELAVDFGENGLWAYEFNGESWTQLSAENPVFMVAGDFWGDGINTALTVSFGAQGLWLYDGRFHRWTQISSTAPDFSAY